MTLSFHADRAPFQLQKIGRSGRQLGEIRSSMAGARCKNCLNETIVKHAVGSLGRSGIYWRKSQLGGEVDSMYHGRKGNVT